MSWSLIHVALRRPRCPVLLAAVRDALEGSSQCKASYNMIWFRWKVSRKCYTCARFYYCERLVHIIVGRYYDLVHECEAPRSIHSFYSDICSKELKRCKQETNKCWKPKVPVHGGVLNIVAGQSCERFCMWYDSPVRAFCQKLNTETSDHQSGKRMRKCFRSAEQMRLKIHFRPANLALAAVRPFMLSSRGLTVMSPLHA